MCKIYGYCRISTKKQNIERQERNILKEYPNAIIYKEEFTGRTTNRPKWEYLEKRLQKGDTVVFDSVSRMSRNADEGTELYFELYEKGVNLVFLKETHINTEVYRKSLEKQLPRTNTNIDGILKAIEDFLKDLANDQIRIAFEQSQKEVDDLSQRTKEGLQTAKLNGKQIGQVKGTKYKTKKSVLAKEQILKHSKSFNGTLKDEELMKMLDISHCTLYKYKKELRNTDTL